MFKLFGKSSGTTSDFLFKVFVCQSLKKNNLKIKCKYISYEGCVKKSMWTNV